MIPILYAQKTTDFSTQGLGPLADAVKCTSSFDGNLAELQLQYPRNGLHFADLQPGAIIRAKPNHWQGVQSFIIVGEGKGTDKLATFKARQECHLADGWPVAPFTAYSARQAIMRAEESLMVAGCPYSLYSDIYKNEVVEVKKPTSLRGVAQALQKQFGGEVVYEGTQTRLLAAAGADRGVVIRYGKDLVQVQQERNIANVITGIVPYFASKSNGGAVVYGDALTVSGTFPFVRIVPVDLTDQFDETPTKAQLNTAGRAYIEANDIGVPEVNLSLSYAELGQDVRIYDTVGVEFELIGISTTAKVCKIVYDVLNERNAGIEVGTPQKTIVDTIKDGRADIRATPTISAMQQAILDQTKIVTGVKGGSIVTHYGADGLPYETLYLDTASEATARNVIRINNAGIGFSTSGVAGPFETAWTIDGHFNAKFITAGTLSVDRIQAKSIKTEKLDDGSVTTAKLGDLAVTTGKIGGSAVTYGKTGFQSTLDQVGVNKSDIAAIRAIQAQVIDGTSVFATTLTVNTNFYFRSSWATWHGFEVKDADTGTTARYALLCQAAG